MLDRQWWRRAIAREWLWIVASVLGGALYVWIPWSRTYPPGLSDVLIEGLLWGVLWYIVLVLLRLTIWSIRTVWARQ